MITLSFRAAAPPSPHRGAVAHRRAVDCESLFLSLDNPHELTQRPWVTQHSSVPHFRPIHQLRALGGCVGFPPVHAAEACGRRETATISLKAVTPIDTALLDVAPGAVCYAVATAVYLAILVLNTVTAATAVDAIAPIGGFLRG